MDDNKLGMIAKLKLLFTLKGPVGDLIGEIKDVKRGYKTVHFWATVLGILGVIALKLTSVMAPHVAIVLVAALAALYNIARALEKADVVGFRPVFKSTEFWVGVGAIVTTALSNLKSGGVDAPWIESAIGLLAAIMAAAQNLGQQQPPEA